MKILIPVILFLVLASCNPTLTKFRVIYVDEGPNEEIVKRTEELLEETFYNVDIELTKGVSSEGNIDSLRNNRHDIAIVENYIDLFDGVNSVFSLYTEILHIFYKKEERVDESFESLMYGGSVYIGKENSPTYNLMMDLYEFYGLEQDRISVTSNRTQADVVVVLTNLLSRDELVSYKDFELFSFDKVDLIGNGSNLDGISLKYPRLEPFIIPRNTYWELNPEPTATLCVDVIMIVRSNMGGTAVTDFTKKMLQNRQLFAPIDPLLYNGMKEDFDRSKLNIPLHEGARVFLDRDEPGFLERYAELGGVILSIAIAIISGLVSLTKWQSQKKKDKIDAFYEELLAVKNSIPKIKNLQILLRNIRDVQTSQNRAFEMLISEELVANDSFRIYMELSKETINELRSRARVLKT